MLTDTFKLFVNTKLIYTQKKYIIISCLVFALIAFEYWEYSGDLIYDTTDVPEVYTWLADDKNSEVIAEYPMISAISPASYSYLFFQRIHKKKLVNGAPPGTKAWTFYKKVNNISKPGVVKLLKEIGTDYVIIHNEKYKEGIVPFARKGFCSVDLSAIMINEGKPPDIPFGLKLHKDFGNDKVYVIK